MVTHKIKMNKIFAKLYFYFTCNHGFMVLLSGQWRVLCGQHLSERLN